MLESLLPLPSSASPPSTSSGVEGSISAALFDLWLPLPLFVPTTDGKSPGSSDDDDEENLETEYSSSFSSMER
jgi:hypothetical protein